LKLTLAQLADCCEGRVVGTDTICLDGVTNLRDADQNKISLYSDKNYSDDLLSTRAGAVITSEILADHFPGNKLIVENPLLALARVINAFEIYAIPTQAAPKISDSARIAPSTKLGHRLAIAANAVVGENVVLGDDVSIGSGVIIGNDVNLGEQTRIDANVSIYDSCQLGKRCHVSSGTVIGSDGFGFAETSNDKGPKWVAVPQIASVKIGDDVHIGANTTIDRGSLEDTVIADGVIIDNLVQIAHNVTIGRHTAIAGCAGIAGSARIGENCKIGGRASILGHIEICDDVVVFADSYVTKSILQPGIYSAAMPAMPLRQWHKVLARFRRN
jgi:UDP-3-O-[3-hydroxymyristoyl] glucosamine N-acyltransferase